MSTGQSDAAAALQPVEAEHIPVATRMPRVVPLGRSLTGTARFGIAVVILFFGIGGGWAATMPLAGATIAPGTVSPEGSRRHIQHLEGGIINEIRVNDGDRVRAGDVLVVMQDVRAKAAVDTLAHRLTTLAAREARLQAERSGIDVIHFRHPALANRDDPDVQAAVGQQVNEFKTRRASDESRAAILGQRINQLEDQIAGFGKQLDSIQRQNALIREELADVESLYRQGYERKARVLALQRAEAELMGTEGDLRSRVAAAHEAIGEIRFQIANLTIQRMEQVDQELSETQARRLEVEAQIREGLDMLARTTVVAPVAGTVMNLRFKTLGGVVRPGEPVLDIVPDDEALIIEARIAAEDIDTVHAGLPAHVLFPSFPQRNLHRIPADVVLVSADAFVDEQTGQRYYTARITVDPEILAEQAPSIVLTPGMPAEVFIRTAERTLLEYLMQPFLQVMERTFREP
ncbi:MAG: HlyD family type I secretion periplasmic adaptor subunit [Rhodospirillales bacterium]|nr:MAG: HlyD family type I secretion periplasmic adaptor subunit [Rhodospirillales bacterium]